MYTCAQSSSRRLLPLLSVSLTALLAGCGDVAPTAKIDQSAQSVVGKPGELEEPDPITGLLSWASHEFRKRSFSPEELDADYVDNRIQLKFKTGSGVRSRNGKLVIDSKKVDGKPDFTSLDAVNEALAQHEHRASVRMHALSEDYLERERAAGQQRTGRDVPDLNLWFHAYVEPKDASELAKLLEELNENPLVELAYPSALPVSNGLDKASQAANAELRKAAKRAPVPTDQQIVELEKGITPEVTRKIRTPAPNPPPPPPPSLTPDFSPLQHYAGAWPRGINALYAQQTYVGAYGENAGYSDVEYAWRVTHEDLGSLTNASLINGTPDASVNIEEFRNHGTAVAGMLSATDNGFGVTGLTSESYAYLSTEFPTSGHNRPNAVSMASAYLWEGGAILLEMQAFAGFDCNGDGLAASDYPQASLPDFVPAEHEPAVKDAVKFATAAGRHVVATGGNGGCNLDQAGFLGAFAMYDEQNLNASVNAHDSGAIFVGSGGADVPAAYWKDDSTYGSRFDVQAQGDWQIVTTGYGNHFQSSGEDTYYTNTFAGTSGAGPIITGAVVSMESVLFSNSGSAYTPKELRRILRRHSTVADLRYKTVYDALNPGGAPAGFADRGRIARPDLSELNEQMNARHFCGRSSDFDGDGVADYAFYRTSHGFAGLWRIKFSGGGESTFQWGQFGDIPCPANIVGDARAELVVYRPTTSEWHIKNLQDDSTQVIAFGDFGDSPIALDRDGDGKANLGVFKRWHPSGPHWKIRHQTVNAVLETLVMGAIDSTPLAADINGDGMDDAISFKAGLWEVAESNNPLRYFVTFGQMGDIPRIRHANGSAQLALFRPEEGKFYYRTGVNTVQSQLYGAPGDIPILADVTGDGTDEFIVFRAPYAKTWVMDNAQPIFLQLGAGVTWARAYETALIPVMQ